MKHLLPRTAALSLAAACLLGTAFAAPALAKDGDVTHRGACSAASDWKLKAGPRDSGIEMEFEVDSNVVGQTWNVHITDNNVSVLTRTVHTGARSGSFEVGKTVANRAGRDMFVAHATNAATGETCLGRVSV